MPGATDSRPAGEHRVYICAGSNVGDRQAHIRGGFRALTADGRVRLTARSSDYMTEPIGFTDQDWFLNTVIAAETSLSPLDLLRRLKSIEKSSGRDYDTIRFGPRTLDLDILLYDDLVMDSPELTIPHPRMHERRFVLKPLCDINANLVHPTHRRRVKDLLDELAEDGQRILAL
jgi:2-amino-4-hydroxy-6-hydroxymethyldihydropteridine diphosphokinase